MLTGTKLADVPGDDEYHGSGAPVRRHMEIVTDSFTIVDRSRLNRARVTCPTYKEILWSAADLMDCVQVIVLEMHHIHLPDRHGINFAAIEQLHSIGTCKRGIDATVRIVPSHLFPMERHRLLLSMVPHHHSTEPFNLFRLQGLDTAGVALREIRELVASHYVTRIQVLQCIRTHQYWRIGKLLQEIDVMHVFVDDYFHRAQENCTVRLWA